MSERKRGGPYPNSLEQLEIQRIGGYPPWNSWKNQVEEELGISFNNGDLKPIESLIHLFYVMRRRHQMAKAIDVEEANKFWNKVGSDFSPFSGQIEIITRFIMRRVPIDSPPTNVGRRR